MFNCHGKTHFVGYFKNEEEAARAYDRAVLPIAGEFARLNFSYHSSEKEQNKTNG